MSIDQRSVAPFKAPPSEASKAIIAAILKVKRAPVCIVCGNQKECGQWLDKTCYFSLPSQVKSKLWSCHTQSDQEMRDSFLQAVDYLVRRAQRFVPRQKLPSEAQEIIEETGFSPALTQYLLESRAD